MKIDIISDVVCPWCIVGYKQLEHALEKTGIDAQIEWHAFELNPEMVVEGENLREHIATKYDTTVEASRAARDNLMKIGVDLGFLFRFSDDMRIVNTFKAHQLLHWCREKGHQHELKMALFSAYFTDGKDISDVNVLLDMAVKAGLDRDQARQVLNDQQCSADVRAEEQLWMSRGVQGVPAMVFNQKYLVTGAQGVENYTAILQDIVAESANSD
jgi:predicted DsbA family dithiol-disulfide isomerase